MVKEKKNSSRPKYIVVVGGVISSVGKGVTSASIGLLLKSRGYVVTNVKCDMYVNVDAGTIRPTEHGEVFVGEDGIEADQDLGNYERFTGATMTRANYITTGQVYQEVIRRERNLEYGGEDVEVVPDIPNEIIRRIKAAQETNDAEVTIIEFGGTVGEYQVILFLEAARMMKLANPLDVCFVMVSYLPTPPKVGEMKTKPTQYAVRTLNSAGIQPDIIIARASERLDKKRSERLATFCNIAPERIISAPDVESIYDIPLSYEKDGLGDIVASCLGLLPKHSGKGLNEWKRFVGRSKRAKGNLQIAVVGKYFGTGGKFVLSDSYISVLEAIKAAAYKVGVHPEIAWLDTDPFEEDVRNLEELGKYDGIVVPGGFGGRGIETKIKAIQYAREHQVPYFGLCYGMQLAVVEYARHVAGIKGANTLEADPKASDPVIFIMPEQAEHMRNRNYGASMRLGSYPCIVKRGSIARESYKMDKITERHRHRYEVNPEYIQRLLEAGLIFSGTSPAGNLMEIMELPRDVHPFFVGTQFHPEFRSTPLSPHPLFVAFIKAAKRGRMTVLS